MVHVNQSIATPQLSVLGGDLTCSSNQVQLRVNTNDINLEYRWTGPNGFLSREQQPIVSISGTYTLIASNLSGCLTTEVVQVGQSLAAPQVSVLGCLLYTSPSPRDATLSRMPSSA